MALEKISLTGSTALGSFGDERFEEIGGYFRLAMVCVQADEHVIFFRQPMRGLGEDDAAKGGVLHIQAGSELAAAG